MAILTLVNNTQSNIEIGDLGLTVQANNSYVLDNRTQEEIRNSADLYAAVSSGGLVVYVSGFALSVPQAISQIVGKVDPTNGIDVLTKLQFCKRFTFQEQVAMEASTDFGVKVVMNNFRIAEYIDLNDPSLGPSLDVLVAGGVITAQRKTEIMTI